MGFFCLAFSLNLEYFYSLYNLAFFKDIVLLKILCLFAYYDNYKSWPFFSVFFDTFVFLSSVHLIHYSLVYLLTSDFSTFFDFVLIFSLIFSAKLILCIYMRVFICVSVPVCGCVWRQDDYHQCHFFSIAFCFLWDYSSSWPGPTIG